jgi:hypothetical protein
MISYRIPWISALALVAAKKSGLLTLSYTRWGRDDADGALKRIVGEMERMAGCSTTLTSVSAMIYQKLSTTASCSVVVFFLSLSSEKLHSKATVVASTENSGVISAASAPSMHCVKPAWNWSCSRLHYAEVLE